MDVTLNRLDANLVSSFGDAVAEEDLLWAKGLDAGLGLGNVPAHNAEDDANGLCI